MADYYSILSRTVSGLPANTADNRKLVYAKARAAIDRQLRNINPPPSDEAIARQMDSLEAAIERIEAENSAAAAPAPAARPATPPPPQQRMQAPAQEMRSPLTAPATSATSVRETSALQRPASPMAGTAANAAPRGQVQANDPMRRPAAAPLPSAAQQARPSGAPRAAGPRAEPPPYDTSLDAVVDVERASRPRPSPASAPRRRPAVEVPARSSSALTTVIVMVVILGLLAGGGYALWRNLDSLMALVGMGGSPAQTEAAAQPETAAPATESAPGADAGAAPKEEARLGGNTAEATDTAEDGTPPPDAAQTQGETQPAEDGQAPLPGTSAEPPADATAQAETPQVRPVEETAQPGADAAQAPADAPATQPAAETTQAATPAIAQKAYLYEEGAAGSGATRDEAAIVWSIEQVSPADGLPPEPVIKGRLEVPGRGLVMDMTIKRNVDEALPASHIIELIFEAPPDFSGGNIENVARFVMKSSEQARGEGLVAVPAKIDTGYFLIALNNLEQAMATNKRLLVESSWIDIPLGYTTKRRALVTLEKGAIGDGVFKEAFAAWDNAPAAAATGQQ